MTLHEDNSMTDTTRLLSATRDQLIDEVLRLRGDLAQLERRVEIDITLAPAERDDTTHDEALRLARAVLASPEGQDPRPGKTAILARALIEACEAVDRWQAGLVRDLGTSMLAMRCDELRYEADALAAANTTLTAERDEAREANARSNREWLATAQQLQAERDEALHAKECAAFERNVARRQRNEARREIERWAPVIVALRAFREAHVADTDALSDAELELGAERAFARRDDLLNAFATAESEAAE